MNSPIALLLGVALVSLAGTAGCVHDSEGGFDEEIAANREKWDASRPERYAYTLRRSCFCPSEWKGPFLVLAQGDSVLSARRIEFQPDETAPETLAVETGPLCLSIPQAFEAAASLLSTEYELKTASFDSRYGFPAEVRIDNGGSGVLDEAESFTIRDFRPLAAE